MRLTGEDAADVTCALQKFPWVKSVHALPPNEHPDAYSLAIVLSPYEITHLVQAHYALVEATGGREIPGRVLYVDAAIHPVHPRWQRVSIGGMEREWAQARVAQRKKQSPENLVVMEAAFKRVAEEIRGALAVSFGPTPILEIVADPFPSPRKMRVLVVDEDPTTAQRIGELTRIDVIEVQDGWSAIDRLKEGDIDLAVCAVNVGGFSGAKIHKLVATANPKMARRIVYLASEAAVSSAPPSSASGRVLARPISADAVRSLLETLGPVG